MRRWLVVLLLVLLPVQFTWAAVSIYCQHPSGSSVEHFGHHEHPDHFGASDHSYPGDSENPVGSDGAVDCGHCHGCVNGVLSDLPGLVEAARSRDAASQRETKPRVVASMPPERPQWARLA